MTADDLIEVARHLADASRTGKAKDAYRRRSISTSYYAVFHALASLCADDLIGTERRETDAWEAAYRALDHGHAKTTLVAIAGERRDAALRLVGEAFTQLQQMRHEADYGVRRTYAGQEAARCADQAAAAIFEIDRLPADARVALAIRLVFRTRSVRR